MLLGIHCNYASVSPTYFKPTEQQRQQALDIVERMSFVGLTDYWEASICLFHAMYGGRITPHEMDNVRYVVLSGGECGPSTFF